LCSSRFRSIAQFFLIRDARVAEPHAAVREVLEYIGLDPDWSHPLIGKKIHDSKKKMRPNALGMLFWEDRVHVELVFRRLRPEQLSSEIFRLTDRLCSVAIHLWQLLIQYVFDLRLGQSRDFCGGAGLIQVGEYQNFHLV
jgi:hypothetical protein